MSKILFQVTVHRLELHIAETRTQIQLRKDTGDLNALRVPFNFLQKLVKDVRAQLNRFTTVEDEDLKVLNEAATALLDGELLLSELETILPVVDSPVQTTTTINQKTISLPKLEAKYFTGNRVEYQSFWQYFELHYHKNTLLQKVEKFSYLLMHLKGEAETVLSHLSPTEENYDSAAKLLAERYGNKTLTIQTIYRQIANHPKALNTVSSLNETYDAIEAQLRALENLGEIVEENRMLLDTILTKFPEQIFMNDGVDISKISNFCKTMQTALRKRESISFITGAGMSKTSPSVTSALITHHAKKEERPKYCAFCESNTHWSEECKKYSTYEARKEKIKGKCFICFKPNHSYKKCRNKEKPCYHCKVKGHHNQSLCPTRFKITSTSQPKETSTNNIAMLPAQEKEKPPAEEIKSIKTLMASNDFKSQLLTVTTNVYNSKSSKTLRTRIILDCGSDRTHITKRCINRLNLEIESTETLHVNIFGSTSPAVIKTPIVHFNLLDISGKVQRISAYVTESIVSHIKPPNVAKFRNKFPQYQNIALADDGLDYDVDILLGMDHLLDVFTWSKIDVDENTLLIDSTFGWLLAHRNSNASSTSNCLLVHSNDPITTLWSLDSIGICEKPNNIEEEDAIQQFYSSITFKDNRYSVSWPWRYYPPRLKSNYGLAV